MELNREQIVKALECCSDGGQCHDCPYCEKCLLPQWEIVKDALALIRELTEENERLEDNLIKQCTENIMLLLDKKDIKADTVRKMQERLKEELYGQGYNHDSHCGVFAVVDKIAKEMLEEGDEG